MRDRLAAVVAGSGGAAAAAAAMGEGRRLGFVDDDGSEVTLLTTATGVEVLDGVDGAGVVARFGPGALDDLIAERWSIFGLLYSGRLEVERGGFDAFAAWEPALQAAFYGRPLYDASAVAALDGVDLHRSFTLDDDPGEMAEHLDRVGFVHVRGVFGPDEVATLSAEVERLRAAARPDDGRSWWATDSSGRDVCCRVTYMADRSAPVAALADDERLHRLASLTGLPLRPTPDRLDGISVVIKNPSVATGLSDLPWHRDCGLGGHPVLCPTVLIGIQLDRADAANGQLQFLAGSHRHAGPLGDPAEAGLPVVPVDTEPGDVTMHYGHALHVAPPPTAPDAGRRAVYVGFSTQELFDAVPAGMAYNDVLYADGDGHIRNVAEASS